MTKDYAGKNHMKYFRIGKSWHNYSHPKEPRYADSFHTRKSKMLSNKTIKIVTYNIKLAKKMRKALNLILQHTDLDNADIICLQEMDPDGVKLIANALEYNYVYYPAILHPRSNKDFGNAIVTKWPIINDQKIILPKLGPGKLQRIAVSATVLIHNVRIIIFCVHMKVYVKHRERRVPIDRIIETIEPSIKHCIIAGDFNTFSKSNCRAILEPLKEANFQSVTEKIGWTYKYWYLLNKKSTLDHIFTRGLGVVNAGKIINRTASDHIPIWGELRIQ
jgi:endonuclease/exonuclease/phosphatase family metal-dependent hydrolase